MYDPFSDPFSLSPHVLPPLSVSFPSLLSTFQLMHIQGCLDVLEAGVRLYILAGGIVSQLVMLTEVIMLYNTV